MLKKIIQKLWMKFREETEEAGVGIDPSSGSVRPYVKPRAPIKNQPNTENQPYVEFRIWSKQENSGLPTYIRARNYTKIPTRIWTEFNLTLDGKTYNKENFSKTLGDRFSGKTSWPTLPPHEEGNLTGDRFNFLYDIIGRDLNKIKKIEVRVDIYLAPFSSSKPESKTDSKHYTLLHDPDKQIINWQDMYKFDT